MDYWHMTQHLYTVAHARFGKGTPTADAWVKHCQWFLDRDLPESARAQIAEWQPQSAEEQKLRATKLGYFAENQERMRYGTFLQRGYHIGSGVVEATCRQLVTQRLKQVGTHWRIPETSVHKSGTHSTGEKGRYCGYLAYQAGWSMSNERLK